MIKNRDKLEFIFFLQSGNDTKRKEKLDEKQFKLTESLKYLSGNAGS